jgi:hypothetical protein
MNAFDIIAIIAILALGYLAWTFRKKAKQFDNANQIKEEVIREKSRLEGIIINGRAENNRLDNLAESRLQSNHDLKKENAQQYKAIEMLMNEKEVLKLDLYKANEITPFQTGPAQDVRGILEALNDVRFVNTATINHHKITLQASELLKEDHISLISKLDKIKAFPESIKSDYNFDVKNLTVDFSLMEINGEGDPIGFKSWDHFLLEREAFISELNEYLRLVIKKSSTDMAVMEVLNGKEVSDA